MLQEVGVLSYSGYFLSNGHLMAMRCNPNSGAGSRIVVNKLLMIYGQFSRSFMFLELQFWNRLCLLENMGFERDDSVVCHCWAWNDMLNCMCCLWV